MPASALAAALRITYERYADVRDDLAQMVRGGLLVKAPDAADLELDAPVSLELVLPDGATLASTVQVLHVFPGVGVAVSVDAELVAEVERGAGGSDAGTGPARHERTDRGAAGDPVPPAARRVTPTVLKPYDALTQAEKIQLALHGNRDQRNAILRDTNRLLHPFVLKNPQLDSDDVLAIVKNAQMTPQLLKTIAGRKAWFQRPQIALALAKNPKTPPDLAVRALDYIPIDALRQLAKGTGALPHVVQAARKKVLK